VEGPTGRMQTDLPATTMRETSEEGEDKEGSNLEVTSLLLSSGLPLKHWRESSMGVKEDMEGKRAAGAT
jgi:hypothetical protein